MAPLGIELLSSFILGALLVRAAPILEARQSFSTLSSADIAAFKPFTFYASTAYCQPAQTLTWSCGGACSCIVFRFAGLTIPPAANCDANPTFKPIASGGDGTAVQFWYVGVDPTLKVGGIIS